MLQLAITTFENLEEILAAEIRSLGGEQVKVGRRVVTCTGDKTFLYRANLELRTGIRVLINLGQFRVRSEQELYDQLRGIDWSPHLDKSGTLLIDTVTQSARFRNGFYLSQLTKDAIVDQFRERTGERPSVSKDAPDLRVQLHLKKNNEVTVSLDASGQGLHRRGYRRRTGGAPLNEVLAAGMLLLAEYDGSVPFVDPMCGSGTLVAEAATIAANQAPGLHRNFGFERWPDFDRELWSSVRQAALDRIRQPPKPILGSDIDELTVSLAKVTLDRTGLLRHVTFRAGAFADLEPLPPGDSGGLLVTNPPYEMRMKTGNIEAFYASIGDTLKAKWAGYTAWLISANPAAVKSVGLRTSSKIMLMNGPVETRFCRYDLYEGSKKGESE
jgi:putative N6-adenine-specific DNA methylase